MKTMDGFPLTGWSSPGMPNLSAAKVDTESLLGHSSRNWMGHLATVTYFEPLPAWKGLQVLLTRRDTFPRMNLSLLPSGPHRCHCPGVYSGLICSLRILNNTAPNRGPASP